MMEARRISQLLTPYIIEPLDLSFVNNISIYINMLVKWNQRINLTAIREPEEIVRRHFGESLFAAWRLLGGRPGQARVPSSAEPERARSAIDAGAGAGFPGLVLKLYAPDLRLTLIESHGKKATFLREIIRALSLAEVSVVQARIEHFAEQAELVTMRAVEKFSEALPAAARLVAPGGRLGALIGASQLDQAKSLLPGKWSTVAVPESASRVLAVWTAA